MGNLPMVHLPLVFVYYHCDEVTETINLEKKKRLVLIFSFVDFSPKLIGLIIQI